MALPYGKEQGQQNYGGGGGINTGYGGGGAFGGGGYGGQGRTPGMMGPQAGIGELIYLMKRKYPNLSWVPQGAGSAYGTDNQQAYAGYSQLGGDQLGQMDQAARSANLAAGRTSPIYGGRQGFGVGSGVPDMLRKLLQARMGGGGGY